MRNKTVTALALAIMAGSSMAAETAVHNDTGASASVNAGDARADAGANTSLAARFSQLDSNGDGVLSRSEAAADPTVDSLYDSLDTSPTIEDGADGTMPGGITRDQFQAGMQAAQKGGTVGPSASGGETYKVYPDGSAEKVEGTGIGAENRMQGAQDKMK